MHSCTHRLKPHNHPHPLCPSHWDWYTRALLVSKDRRVLFESPPPPTSPDVIFEINESFFFADDLYAATKYDNDLAWIIMSAENTGHFLTFLTILMRYTCLLYLDTITVRFIFPRHSPPAKQGQMPIRSRTLALGFCVDFDGKTGV